LSVEEKKDHDQHKGNQEDSFSGFLKFQGVEIIADPDKIKNH
jgi:hypothetical protein